MARVNVFHPKETERHSVHSEVEATFSTFSKGDSTYLQIDTYGSPDREFKGKISQSLQFGPEGIAALRDILSQLP
jgi:hypothetical protein